MRLLNLAIAFAVLGLVGLGIMFFTTEAAEGIMLILIGELGAFVCVYEDQRRIIQRRLLDTMRF